MSLELKPETSKYCTRCYRTKDHVFFYKNSARIDGVSIFCKICTARYASQRPKNKTRAYHRQKTYGLTEDMYTAMLQKQNNKCANIACSVVSSDTRNLDVDHDHKTGRIRGLLCRFCNTGLGAFRDDSNLLLGIKAYITNQSETYIVGITQDAF